ncbi:MAG: hypothetical protein M1368_11125 [Thaumarchaeota archaeon]|nr:hypothetical protein [Nitrososphaerota archaeon]
MSSGSHEHMADDSIIPTNEKIFSVGSLATLFVPIIGLAVATLSGSFLLLDYVHVLSGATWTGIDLFMGLVMSRILRSLPPPSRAQFIKKLVPIMLFLMPSLASVAITAGVLVAMHLGLNFLSPPIIVAGVIVLVLSVQGFGLLLPTEIRIFLELRKQHPDTNKIVRLGMRNIYVSGSQAIFQITIIFLMAVLATM